MDGRFFWKRTEETEIDLADLLCRLCGQWRRIAACALACAIVFGGAGWLKGRGGLDIDVSGTKDASELTETEEQEVASAVQLQNEISGLESYLDNSVLMQLDAYHKNKFVMFYCIDHAKRQELPAITESYLNFVLNGGAADVLTKDGRWKMDKSCLAELISAYQKTYSSPYQIIADSVEDDVMMSESLFYVELTGENAEQAEKLAMDLQDVLEEYSARVKKSAGSHRLTLVSSAKNMTADSGLQSQQHDKKALLSSNKTALRTMTAAFSEEQMAVYEKAVGVTDENRQKEDAADVSGKSTADRNFASVMKYILLGLAGGIFAYCGIFVCWYVFCDTVKSAEELRRLYTFPVYGGILLEDEDRKKGSTVPGMRKNTCACTEEQAVNRIRLVCQKKEITNLCAASGFPLASLEKECLERMAGQLKDQGICLSVAENADMDTAVWDDMASAGNVLMVCRTDTTTHRMIDDTMMFYAENDISVIGAVAFDQGN